MAAEKKVVFRSAWLPWLLIAPQLLVVSVFFFWPAGQALLQSLQQSDAFGTTVESAGMSMPRPWPLSSVPAPASVDAPVAVSETEG